MLEFADDYFIDYAWAEAWLNKSNLNDIELFVDQLPEFLAILKKGTLFQNMNESWVDPYIDRMSNQIIEYGLSLFHLLSEKEDEMLLLEVAEGN